MAIGGYKSSGSYNSPGVGNITSVAVDCYPKQCDLCHLIPTISWIRRYWPIPFMTQASRIRSGVRRNLSTRMYSNACSRTAADMIDEILASLSSHFAKVCNFIADRNENQRSDATRIATDPKTILGMLLVMFAARRTHQYDYYSQRKMQKTSRNRTDS